MFEQCKQQLKSGKQKSSKDFVLQMQVIIKNKSGCYTENNVQLE